MILSLRRFSLVLAAGLVIGLSGCVSSTQLDEAMSLARQAQSDAAAARDAASKAERTAIQAQDTATKASMAAAAAQRDANAGQSCCAANSEKIERMFKESMRK